MRLPASKPKRARIEIVPMIDTVFFLLVYFMIATLTMTRMNAQKVALPVSQTAAAKPANDIVVTVAANGRFFIDRDPVSESGVTAELNARLKKTPAAAVVINCDKDQPAGRFARIFDLVKQSDAANVMVATTPKDHWENGQ
ncbi:biopolymer transporter ExbD [Capsulimonas corticalis]|uniref:Biopolymer transporter ExbD n=1 Tax=Capsulimonas corticalis TaxID=2219043 RepID=A0A402CUX6_9BACT|nr:biopolymer transporter ExbD [Capsulimonas corticalis]BDI30246.1 biopolymer transporter ExbD [Capsulimonas corticalis]